MSKYINREYADIILFLILGKSPMVNLQLLLQATISLSNYPDIMFTNIGMNKNSDLWKNKCKLIQTERVGTYSVNIEHLFS